VQVQVQVSLVLSQGQARWAAWAQQTAPN